MPVIKPFRALRPAAGWAEKIHIHHGDAGDPDKVRIAASTNPYSFLHVSHADILLSSDKADSAAAKDNSRRALQQYLDSEVLIRDKEESLYILRLTRGDHIQTGLIACVSAEDVVKGKIKKHELTRNQKTRAQERQIELVGGNIEPVLLAYDSRNLSEINGGSSEPLIEKWADSHECCCEMAEENGTLHQFWQVTDPRFIAELRILAEKMDAFYICDGHHRVAAAVKYMENHPGDAGKYFTAAIFPSEEMLILDYNRGVRDLAGLNEDQFLDALNRAGFGIEYIGDSPVRPSKKGQFTMTMDGKWYRLDYEGQYGENPAASIDVSVLQDLVLDNILGIKDPQHDDRIAFISGNKGIQALADAAGPQGDLKVAFAIFPVSMNDIINVSNANLTMPPKSTCFEPKLVAGLIVNLIE